MSKKSYVIAAAVALAGCAGQKQETQQPTQERQAQENVVPFDLYNCSPRKVEVPSPVNQAGLTAVWANAQPLVGECMVPPSARGPALNTDVNVKLSDTEQGPTVDVQSTNLTPAGVDCIKKAVLSSGNIPPLESGAQPVSVDLKISHVLGQSPALKKGANEISDLAIPIREAVPNMCECFAPWKDAAPKSFVATLHVVSAATPAGEGDEDQAKAQPAGPAKVTVDFAPFVEEKAQPAQPAQPAADAQAQGQGGDEVAQPAPTEEPKMDATTEQVTACMKPKIEALQLKPTSKEVTFQLPFWFMNTAANVDVTDAPPQVRYLQLDGLRRQRATDAAIAVAKRADAVKTYGDLVTSYNTNKKSLKGQKLMDTLKELSGKCQELVAADGTWKDAAAAQLEVDNRAVELAQELTKSNPRWSAAVTAAQKQADQDKKDLDQVTAQQAKDSKICPKVKY